MQSRVRKHAGPRASLPSSPKLKPALSLQKRVLGTLQMPPSTSPPARQPATMQCRNPQCRYELSSDDTELWTTCPECGFHQASEPRTRTQSPAGRKFIAGLTLLSMFLGGGITELCLILVGRLDPILALALAFLAGLGLISVLCIILIPTLDRSRLIQLGDHPERLLVITIAFGLLLGFALSVGAQFV